MDKKTFFKKLKRTGSFSLTQNEKLYSKEELIHFMQKHPVRNPDEARHQMQKARTAFVPLQLIYSMKPMTALIVLALVFGLGGGTSFAANDSLPGDTLYPVKIHVNERVESVLAFSEEAEAEFNLEKAEVRLQEAENLAVENKGSANALAKVEARFDKHVERTERLATKMETKGKEAKAAEINARLEAMLEVHSQILTLLQERLDNASENTEVEIETETENDNEEFGEFVAKIKIKAAASEEEDNDEGEESDEDEGPSMQAALNAEALVKKHFERITRFADKRGAKATAELSAEAKSHLDAAEVLIAEGEAQLDAENYAEAFASFHEAHKYTQRANSIIASSAGVGLKLGIEKRNSDGDEANEEETEESDDDGEENEENNEEDEEEDTEVEAETEVETEAQLNVSDAHVKTDANFMQRVWSRF